MVLPIFLGNIGDDFITAIILKIQIYIRQLLTLHVKKALKDQLIFNRVNFGDAQAVEGNAGGGATSNPKKDVVLLGEGDDVPDDEEIVGKLGLPYYFQLVVKSLFYLRGRLGVILTQTLITEVSQKLVGSFIFRQLYLREVKATKLKLEIAHFSNALGILQRLRNIAVKLCHLLWALEVEEIARHLHSLFIMDRSVRSNTQ